MVTRLMHGKTVPLLSLGGAEGSEDACGAWVDEGLDGVSVGPDSTHERSLVLFLLIV